MHYLLILPVIGILAFATGGHSSAFGKSYEAAVRGDVSTAADLFATAVQRTLSDADQPRRQKLSQAVQVLASR